MRTIPAQLQAHLDSGVITLAVLWKVVRRDGVILGFTDCDHDLVISGLTYQAATGYTRTTMQFTADLSVDNLELEGLLSSDAITDEDLRGGKYFGAEITISVCNYEDLAAGVGILHKGWIGQITIRDNVYVAEMRGLADRLQQVIGRIYGRECDADLGDSRCGVRLEPPAWLAGTPYIARPAGDAKLGSVVRPSVANGRYFRCSVMGTSGASEPVWNTTLGGTTVDGGVTWVAIEALKGSGTVGAIVDSHTFNDASLTSQIGTGGLLTWVTGDNAGISQEIKEVTVSANVILWEVPPFVVTVGDTYTFTAGCQKRRVEDCITLYDNAHNFRGFDTIPGTDYLANGNTNAA